jgi:activating signal cointegrator 1
MKALTLTQPWASLVAIGAKKIETRSWSTDYRGPLAIHAAKGLGPVGGKTGLRALIESQPFNRALCDVGSNGMLDWWGKDVVDELPLGAIVAVCRLVSVIQIDRIEGNWLHGAAMIDGSPVMTHLTSQERAFGDYAPKRFAWLLTDLRPIDPPIPAKGALSLWDWDEPATTRAAMGRG